MTRYFFDSSALLKRYIQETGSAWVQEMTNPDKRHQIIISQITMVEVNSGFARQKREGFITQDAAKTMSYLLDRHATNQYSVFEFNRTVSQRAVALLQAYPLRAYDAVQLASALTLNEHMRTLNEPPLTFVSADVRLLAVAEAAGLPIVNPNTAT